MRNDQQLLEQVNREMERASLYLLKYTDSLKPVQNIMIAQGILTGMLSDILKFQIDKGITEKSKDSQSKVLQLMEIMEGFSKIEDHNRACRLNIASLLNRIVELETENEEKVKVIEANQKAWEQTV